MSNENKDEETQPLIHSQEEHGATHDDHTRHKVLICVDSSENSKKAIDYALNKVVNKDDNIIIMTVIEGVNSLPVHPRTRLAVFSDDLIKKLEKKDRDEAVKLLHNMGEKFIEKDMHPRKVAVRCGHFATVKDAILEFSHKEKPDVLVMASRGLGTIKRAFLGSTSDFCLHHCECPVLVVK